MVYIFTDSSCRAGKRNSLAVISGVFVTATKTILNLCWIMSLVFIVRMVKIYARNKDLKILETIIFINSNSNRA